MLNKTERKEQIAQVHRDAIINAAQSLFFTKGFEQTTIDDIAANAQYSKRTLYKYIASKEVIYDEIAVRAYDALHQVIQYAHQQHPDDPVLSLRAVLEQSLQFAYAQPGFFNVILNYHVRAANFDLNNLQHQLIDRYDRQILVILQSIIAQGIQQKIFRQNINPSFMAAYLVTIHIGMVTMLFQKSYYLKNGLQLSATEFIQQTMESMLYTLMVSPELIQESIAPITFGQE